MLLLKEPIGEGKFRTSKRAGEEDEEEEEDGWGNACLLVRRCGVIEPG